jgi:hypothetical protein
MNNWPAGNAANLPDNTCLIVGGSYRGGVTTYYCVDFVDKNSSDAFLPSRRKNKRSAASLAVFST